MKTVILTIILVIVLAYFIYWIMKGITCPDCGKGKLRQSDIHISERYLETNIYECSHCKRRFI